MNEYEKRLIQIYLSAETAIINELARLRSHGFADYHAEAALRRVQAILVSMQSEAWKYTPKMVERYFYAARPERRAMPTTAEAALGAYQAAMSLTSERTGIVRRLAASMMGELEAAGATVINTLSDYLVGRRTDDPFRRRGLSAVAQGEAEGNLRKQNFKLVEDLRRNGITAFVDKAGRHWRLHTYAAMVTRTTARQAEVLAVLTQDPEHDLYTIKGVGDPCGLCAPYQNRVYSKSGTDQDFPPLADAFGKIDPFGGETLTNTWLNIHPNCRCAVVKWLAGGKSERELERIKRFSDPNTNPYRVDPRSLKAREAYRRREAGREKWLGDYYQWERYQRTISRRLPKTFQTFLKHKRADDDIYRAWVAAYRTANREGERA